MSGHPLSRLIADRIRYYEDREIKINVATTIRGVMEDVEQVARFDAPRAFQCYRDLLQIVLRDSGRNDLLAAYPDFTMLLEYGVAQETQISLISAGLSRTSTIAITELMSASSLSREEALGWLSDNRELWRAAPLSTLVKRELEDLLSLVQA